MTYSILDKINSPADLKMLSVPDLKLLCAQIRDYMVDCCSTNPGHLGSSLGAVELIVGMHYVFNAPGDKLVFDVSHQAYAHKIITGRMEAFKANRRRGGISGFTKMDESPYDAFGAGHASTSISAALGYAKAFALQGNPAKAVALIGDGSLSGGMAFEGLNNAGDPSADLLVIVNDNNMSIDGNIGALHRHLLTLTTAPLYNSAKNKVWNFLGEGKMRRFVQGLVTRIKSSLVQHSGGDLFEGLGFRYFGPIDGNDIGAVVKALERIRDLHGPRILHTVTKKGKGYAPAEENQTVWHAPGLFDPETGRRIKTVHKEKRYQDVFGQVLVELARKNPKIVGITPAMASGCGMSELSAEMPDRFFDTGIAEEHAVTFSAGLAAGGLKPFCNIYSSFSQRAYDQIIHDVALQHLGVVICLDRAGLVGEDGPTHHGAFDLAAYRSIPGCTIAVPRNELELKRMMYSASLCEKGPYIIRYPRGYGEGVEWETEEFSALPTGKGEKLREGSGVAVIALGPFANRAVEAADELGKKVTVWDAKFLKPFDPEIIADILSGNFSTVVTIEDGCLKGGLHSEIAEALSAEASPIRLVALGIPDRFIGQGTQDELRTECSLTKERILEELKKIVVEEE